MVEWRTAVFVWLVCPYVAIATGVSHVKTFLRLVVPQNLSWKKIKLIKSQLNEFHVTSVDFLWDEKAFDDLKAERALHSDWIRYRILTEIFVLI